MKIPELKGSEKHVGLYIVDFGQYTSVSFTALEVTELPEKENSKRLKLIHNTDYIAA
jgi:hypothetical protein